MRSSRITKFSRWTGRAVCLGVIFILLGQQMYKLWMSDNIRVVPHRRNERRVLVEERANGIGTLSRLHTLEEQATFRLREYRHLPLCPERPTQLLGHHKPNVMKFPSEADVEKELSGVSRGCWRPSGCRPKNGSIAILFPSHGRRHHLLLTLKYLVPLLQRQQQDFCVYAGEQAPGSANERFNKGATADALFKEAMKERNWTCVSVHDVDMIPEDDRMSYSCPGDHIRHLTASIDKWGYGLPYPQVFGGGTISMSSHFVKYNGLSTAFWGWGTEDDDHRQRIGWAGLHWARLDKEIARYTHIPHESSKTNPNRFWFARHAHQVWQDYGLNTLKYKVNEVLHRKLYTLFRFQLPKQGPNSTSAS